MHVFTWRTFANICLAYDAVFVFSISFHPKTSLTAGGPGFYKVHLEIAVTFTKSPFLSALRFGKSSPSPMSEVLSSITQLPQIELMGKNPGPLCVSMFSLLGTRDRKTEASWAPLGGLHWETLNRRLGEVIRSSGAIEMTEQTKQVIEEEHSLSSDTHRTDSIVFPEASWSEPVQDPVGADAVQYLSHPSNNSFITGAFLAGLLLFKQT